MKSTIYLRTFSHPDPWKGKDGKEHAYYVSNCVDGGLTEASECIAIDSTDTILSIRQTIEEQQSGNIMRRRLFYYEFVHFMQRCPNPLGYEGDALKTYRIGLLKYGDMNDMKLVKKSEESKPISDIVDDLVGIEIVLIPTTQIHPMTDKLTDQL